jgi:hypothetical protein
MMGSTDLLERVFSGFESVPKEEVVLGSDPHRTGHWGVSEFQKTHRLRPEAEILTKRQGLAALILY